MDIYVQSTIPPVGLNRSGLCFPKTLLANYGHKFRCY